MQLFAFTLGWSFSCHSGVFPPSSVDGFFNCVYSGVVNPASLPELFFHPPPWFFQCNSAREQLSGGGLSSVTNLNGFLLLIRADVFPDHLALTLGLILCECSIATSIFYYSWVTRQLPAKKIFQAGIPDAFSTGAVRHCKAEQSSGASKDSLSSPWRPGNCFRCQF